MCESVCVIISPDALQNKLVLTELWQLRKLLPLETASCLSSFLSFNLSLEIHFGTTFMSSLRLLSEYQKNSAFSELIRKFDLESILHVFFSSF